MVSVSTIVITTNLDDKVRAIEGGGVVEALLHALANVLRRYWGGVRPEGQSDVPQACSYY